MVDTLHNREHVAPFTGNSGESQRSVYSTHPSWALAYPMQHCAVPHSPGSLRLPGVCPVRDLAKRRFYCVASAMPIGLLCAATGRPCRPRTAHTQDYTGNGPYKQLQPALECGRGPNLKRGNGFARKMIVQ